MVYDNKVRTILAGVTVGAGLGLSLGILIGGKANQEVEEASANWFKKSVKTLTRPQILFPIIGGIIGGTIGSVIANNYINPMYQEEIAEQYAHSTEILKMSA